MLTYICLLLLDNNWSQPDDQLFKLLPPKRKLRIEQLYFDSDKLLSLYSVLLLSYMLENFYNINDALQSIVWEKNKKPTLNESYDIDFSYSHTNRAVLCGITNNNSIGVDIEALNSPPYEIMPLVFHPNEIHYINNSFLSPKHAFYKIWTQKEAFTKKIGTGLSDNIVSIDTQTPLSVYFNTWIQEQYICSICLDRQVSSSQIKYIDLSVSQLRDYFLNK